MAAWEDHGGELWRRAAAALGLWSITVDAEGAILDASDAVAEATGIAAADFRGDKLWSLAADPHERALLRDEIFPVAPDALPPGFVLRVMAGDGDVRVIEWSAVPCDGTPFRLFLAGIDRTVRESAARALRKGRDWYRQLLGQLPAILWTTDRDLYFTSSTGAGLAMLGVREDQMVGVPLGRYFAGEENPNIERHARALAGDTVRFDTEWLGRTFQTVLAPLRTGPDAKPTGTIGLAIDITDRVRAEAERDRSLESEQGARERAEAALAARDEFLSVAAHELYTPMTSLQLSLQSVMARDVEGDAAQRLLRLADRQTQRLLTIIHDLLDVSRIHTRRLTLRTARVDLSELARDAAARFAQAFQKGGSQLEVVSGGSVWGEWDAERLDQVLTNLLTNALTHAPGSAVKVTTLRDGDRARLVVSDAGPGIAAGSAERIFDRFERASSTEHHGGLGLGLYIVREIAEAHGGAASVESSPGGGATFCIELPVSAAREESFDHG